MSLKSFVCLTSVSLLGWLALAYQYPAAAADRRPDGAMKPRPATADAPPPEAEGLAVSVSRGGSATD